MKKMIIAAVIAAGASTATFAQAEPMSREALSVFNTQASSPSAISNGSARDNSFLGKYRTFDGRVNQNQVVDTEIAAFEMVSEPANRRYSARSDRNN